MNQPAAGHRLPRRLCRWMDYFGAHRVPERQAHEFNRAVQRVIIALLVPGLYAYRLGTDGPLSLVHQAFALFCTVYAVAAGVYSALLRKDPDVWPVAQYGFLILDSFLIIGSLFFEAKALAIFLPFVPFLPLGAGFRFGARTMMLHWALLLFWTAALFPLSEFWRAHALFAVSCTIWLALSPVVMWSIVSVVGRARALEIDQARVATKSEFLARIAHELRSPLQSIVGTLELWEASAGRGAGAEQKDLVDRVRRSANRLQSLVQDLLLVARGDVGALHLNQREFDVRSLVADVVRESQSWAREKRLELKVSMPEEPVMVHADESRLSQILVNLLTNALKYTEAGWVRVTLSPGDSAPGMFALVVEDTGIGIPASLAARIFQPFERGSRAADSDTQSAGLGLAVVRTLCARMGGTIELETSEGVGSKFTVRLPTRPPADQAA